MKDYLMGNQAIGLGAIRAGIRLAAGYPGTPSTEVLETIAHNNKDKKIYVEWSTNEKAALEVAAGAAISGCRALVTMKQVGLNVASDPLMSLAYVGVEGGLVVLAADDPGPISSQTEQDTRDFARFARIPVFDPSTPEEAYLLIAEAFACSEKYHTPVIFRPTTRICHGSSDIELLPPLELPEPAGFQRDTRRWVIFPRSSYLNHLAIEERNPRIGQEFSGFSANSRKIFPGKGQSADCEQLGIAAGGISYAYIKEAIDLLPQHPPLELLKIATPHPFPEELAADFLRDKPRVLVAEELSPVIERELQRLCGKLHLPAQISGKADGLMPSAGENGVDICRRALGKWLGLPDEAAAADDRPDLPLRPPVLCAGCPHRGAFYSVKQAMTGRKAIFCGDIGCYTLGNAQPLDMVDTCLCMGAGVTMAQGLARCNPDAACFAFIGDSTFFASGITGVINAAYNHSKIILVVLDNSTTAMTGHQPHPGTGRTMMEENYPPQSIESILTAIGVPVQIVDPLDLNASVASVKKAADSREISAIIFRSPCIALSRPSRCYQVDQSRCSGCRACIQRLGCPAIILDDNEAVQVEPALCTGCGLCAQVCPCHALGPKGGR